MLPFLERKSADVFHYPFNNFAFAAHFHAGLEIVIARSGVIILNADGRSFEVNGGEIGIALPDEIHSYDIKAGFGNSGDILVFSERMTSDFNSDFKGRALKNPVFSLNRLDKKCALALGWLLEDLDADMRTQKAYASLLLSALLPSAELIATKASDDSVLHALIGYMEEHFKEDIHLSDAAAALYANRTSLSRVFSNALKISFNDYLNSLRLNYAVSLMGSGARSMTEIAFASGFSNVRTFNRAFLKLYGKTPGEYKKEES